MVICDQTMLLRWAPVLLLLVSLGSGFQMGAPDSACGSLMPSHFGEPQTSTSPFRVDVGSDSVRQGEKLNITLVGDADDKFKGFLVQARAVDGGEIIGSFEGASYLNLSPCSNKVSSAITHQNSDPKDNVAATWKAPSDFQGDFRFHATFVQDYAVYWVDLPTRTLRVERSLNTPTVPTAPPSTRQPAVANDQRDSATLVGLALDAGSVYEGCNVDKGCFGLSSLCVKERNCEIMATYRKVGGKYRIQMIGSIESSRGYLALGFSSDGEMGSDPVVVCHHDPSPSLGAIQGYNLQGGVKSCDVLPSNTNGISDFRGTLQGNTYACEFSLDPKYVVRDHEIDLDNSQYFLLIAHGNLDGETIANGLSYHTNRHASSESVSFSSVGAVSAAPPILIRLHGSLMIAAWVGAAGIGMVFARYFKATWVGSQLCGKDVWFTVHRSLMVLTWSLTVAAFVIIFVHVQGWTAVPLSTSLHPIFGCITTGLAFVQPFMAMLRPHPGTKNRPIFNWAHWLVGNSAHIAGMVTLFMAQELSASALPQWTDYVLVAYVAFHFIMHLVLSIHMCWSDSRAKRKNTITTNSYPMSERNGNGSAFAEVERSSDLDAPGSAVRRSLLGIYIVVCLMLTALLILMVVFAPADDWKEIFEQNGQP